MKRNTNIITLKIRYDTDASSLSLITTLQKQFNSCLRFTYNRLCDNKRLTTKELTALQKNLNNIMLIKSHLKNSAIYKAKEMIATGTGRSVIFGGKTNFIKRCLNKISKYVYISVDNSVFEKHVYRTIKNRVIAIDINPEFIGWSITDWSDTNYKIVASGLISLQPLNNKHKALRLSSDDKKNIYFNNKRKHEVIHVAKQLFMLCKHYRCETFAMEDLDMKSKAIRNKRINRLINNLWCRNLLTHQIKKHILCSPATFIAVQPQYSSVIGNIVYRDERLPDPVLASIEIGRRGFEYGTQYIYKRRQLQKTVILPDFNSVRTRIHLSLEEMGIRGHVKNWLELFSAVKKSGMRYRFPLAECLSASYFSKFYK